MVMPVKIYLAGPLFTTPEREWNVGLAARFRAGGHDVLVPQENPASERTGRATFVKDLASSASAVKYDVEVAPLQSVE